MVDCAVYIRQNGDFMKQYSISNLYTLEETIAAELFGSKEYPWEVQPEISLYILKLGERLNPD